ncbi:MAG TPA: branched-chain amino acid ABC transporter permease [Candidatus Polarisedimenticolaceae bacterium]|nr:branched-chain amino acid ABC transporter permease [Candidatus Polarisedimenticolaceae bacterium]
MTKFLQTLMDGIAVGSLYALIALGYTMVYGILQFINFAHSDIFVLGAWISYTIAVALGYAAATTSPPAWESLLIILAAMATCGAVGFTIERLAYRPLRKAPRLNVLITAIGVSLFLQNVGQLKWFFGTQPQRMPAVLDDRILGSLAGVQIHSVDLIGAATALGLMVVLDWLIFRTRLGRAMRAVSHDIAVASLMGINVDAVISFTFVLGSSLAAAAGFLYAMKYPGLNQPAHATWVLLGLKAFVAAVIGGIGNIRGAMLGGILIGFIELFGAAYLSPHLRDIYVFSILILVLLVRPTGILGKPVAEKV